MKYHLYFIRHGETTANRDEILQGHCDFPLTEKGIEQADSLGDKLKNIKWDLIYSSDLQRAYITTNHIISKSKYSYDKSHISRSELIREVSFGIREGLSRHLTTEEAKIEYAKNNSILVDNVVDHAETQSEVKYRQEEFLKFIVKECKNLCPINESLDHFKILCTSHGGYIKRFINNFLPLNLNEKIENCSVSLIEVEYTNQDINEDDIKMSNFKFNLENSFINRVIWPDSENIYDS